MNHDARRLPPVLPPDVEPIEPSDAKHGGGEDGKVGLAILMWLLGVPGFIVLLYLIFAK